MDGEIDRQGLKARLLECLGTEAKAYPVHIEQHFPRILARIVELWASAELDQYLQSLMVSDRTDRQGFPPDVAMEIFRLSMIHGALGLTSPVGGTGWAGVDDAELYKKSTTRKDRDDL